MDPFSAVGAAVAVNAAMLAILSWRDTRSRHQVDTLAARVATLNSRVACLEEALDDLMADKALLINSLQEHRDHIFRHQPPPPPPYPNLRK